MTNLKLALACGMLLAAISVTNREMSVTPAQPFWELQGAAPARGRRGHGGLVREG